MIKYNARCEDRAGITPAKTSVNNPVIERQQRKEPLVSGMIFEKPATAGPSGSFKERKGKARAEGKGSSGPGESFQNEKEERP